MSGRRLSKRVRWIDHKPVALTAGDLYFEVEMPDGTKQWARVVGGSPRLRLWWMHRILNRTEAVQVSEVSE